MRIPSGRNSSLNSWAQRRRVEDMLFSLSEALSFEEGPTPKTQWQPRLGFLRLVVIVIVLPQNIVTPGRRARGVIVL